MRKFSHYFIDKISDQNFYCNFDNYPLNINKLIEFTNIQFLKKLKQNIIKVGKYEINLALENELYE